MTITLLSPPRPTLKPISTAQAADQRPLMRFAIPEDYFPPGQGVPLSWATTADWPRAWPFRGPSRPLAARRGSLLCPEEPRVPAHGPAKRGGGLFAGAGPRKARRAGRDNSRQRPGPAKTAYPALRNHPVRGPASATLITYPAWPIALGLQCARLPICGSSIASLPVLSRPCWRRDARLVFHPCYWMGSSEYVSSAKK